MILKLLKKLQKNIWPYWCVFCGHVSHTEYAVCNSCYANLPWRKEQCYSCGRLLQNNLEHIFCASCQDVGPPFYRLVTLFNYRQPLVSVIKQLKFANGLYHADWLGKLLSAEINRVYHKEELPEVIIPMPLHSRRWRFRGYNQALEIAKIVKKQLPEIQVLPFQASRVKLTKPQATLTVRDRFKNIHGAFQSGNLDIEHVAIIDDVVTTACTVKELTRILLAAGVLRVDVWCICCS